MFIVICCLYLLFVVCCLLFIVCCLLLVVCCVLEFTFMKNYTMLATRRVGYLFPSRPTVGGCGRRGHVRPPPANAQLRGPARRFLRLFQSYPLRSRPWRAWRRADAAGMEIAWRLELSSFASMAATSCLWVMRYVRVGDGRCRQVL